jgi:Spy/CpxP family protein refolding chaperone
MLKRTLLAAMMAAVIVSPSLGQPGPGHKQGPGRECEPGRCECRGEGQMPRHGAMMEMLKLTDQQKGQMEKLRTELEKKQVTVHGRIAVLRVEMKELFQAENPDRNAIEKKMKEVSDLQHQLKVNGLDHMFAVKGILTPEQQKTWKEHMLRAGEEEMGRMKGRMRERMR